MKKLMVASLLVALAGCSSVTIQPERVTKLTTKPTYQNSRPFFLWGLVGEQRVDVKAVCGNNKVVQMQSQATFGDGALSLITLGIYSPHTVKVWCDSQSSVAMEANNAN